jgi:HEAT repeat protein
MTARSDEFSARAIHRFLPVFIGACFVAFPEGNAAAHTIPGAQTLHDLCRGAEVVAVGKITLISTPEPGSTKLPPVRADVSELIRAGDEKPGSIWFWPHRHGNDNYVVGEELLLFLDRTRSADAAKEAKYEALESIGDRFIIPPEARDIWIDAAKKYVALGKGPRTATDPQALGRISLSMLASSNAQLAHLALRDLTLNGAAPIIGEKDVPELLRIVDDAKRPAMLRVGLLSELERRKLTPVGAHWVSMLDSTPTNERSAVISGAKSRWFVPEVNSALVTMIDKGSSDEAISAARAVGAEGNEAAVEALVQAAVREPAELRFAALGSLRRINSVKAREQLAEFAKTHPDPDTRKAAQSEMMLLPANPAAAKTLVTTAAAPATISQGTKRILIVMGILVVVFTAVGLGKQAQRAKERG